mmetsp:Transcript_76/g.268  ORF Transcript_76/g.268 Transcript_76/m.268 type:complete len:473 (+) Transcript_76:127-1545(+)
MLAVVMDASDWLPVLLEYASIHVVVYTTMFGVIAYLLMQKSYKPRSEVVLTSQEIRECLETWKPVPLVPPVAQPEMDKLDNDSVALIEGIEGRYVTVEGERLLNATSYDFLGYAHTEGETMDAARSSLIEYGPGSCGPRQFYGTLDIHLKFEEEMAKFLGTPSAILYASGLATATSVIPAFSTRLDYIVCDDGAKHSIQVGNYNSRSRVRYFKHNDMGDLDQQMREVIKKMGKKKSKRFVVVEGVYQNYGDLCRLPEVVALCKKHKFHLIVDDSFGLGTVGPNGKGTVEHYGLSMEDIDIYIADVSFSLACLGGVCCGATYMVNVQRLNGSGYIFSASNPPYLVASGISALKRLGDGPADVENLQRVARELHAGLAKIPTAALDGAEDVPVKMLKLAPKYEPEDKVEAHRILQQVVDAARRRGIACSRAKFSVSQKFMPPPAIKLTANRNFTAEEVGKLVDAMAASFEEVLS